MRRRTFIGASFAAALLLGCAQAGDGVKSSAGEGAKSGLQPGEHCTPFHPLNVTGDFAGQKQCLV
jgi:hypothetical protein